VSGDNNDVEMDGGTVKNEHTDSCGEPALPPKKANIYRYSAPVYEK
jgi:hypothetical protein